MIDSFSPANSKNACAQIHPSLRQLFVHPRSKQKQEHNGWIRNKSYAFNTVLICLWISFGSSILAWCCAFALRNGHEIIPSAQCRLEGRQRLTQNWNGHILHMIIENLSSWLIDHSVSVTWRMVRARVSPLLGRCALLGLYIRWGEICLGAWKDNPKVQTLWTSKIITKIIHWYDECTYDLAFFSLFLRGPSLEGDDDANSLPNIISNKRKQ